LRTAIEKAKAAGLPNDNIKRAIEKGAGQSSADNYEEIVYEGYAAGGVAVVVEAMTDNKNRPAGDIRSYFTKFNGNLGETGCVGWMFDRKGCITFDKSVDYEKLFEAAINLDAEDILDEEEEYKVITSYENLQAVTEGLEKEGFKSVTAEFTRIPQNEIEVTDEKIATNIMRLYTRLDEHDDVQNVYMNFDIDDELMEKLDY
jgi:YebC/PmpR family DNA-binding regulatory protein